VARLQPILGKDPGTLGAITTVMYSAAPRRCGPRDDNDELGVAAAIEADKKPRGRV